MYYDVVLLGWLLVWSQVGSTGWIANDSTRLAEANFGGVTLSLDWVMIHTPTLTTRGGEIIPISSGRVQMQKTQPQGRTIDRTKFGYSQ
jgi:hypothetical protein